jgi:hypothetical protein
MLNGTFVIENLNLKRFDTNKRTRVSFENMWTNNKPVISQSCTEFDQANPSEQELNDLHDSIQQVATETKVDHRYILAIIMQESKGCIRVPTTNGGFSNPGLMQDHGGTGTCDGMNPCPKDNIVQMIHDGTAGTAGGDGLATLLCDSVTSPFKDNVAQGYYRAARAYNSGSVASSGQLQDGGATHCYASDIANRLVGWVKAQHACPFDNNS